VLRWSPLPTTTILAWVPGMLDLVWFLLVGAVAGWLAGKLTKGKGFGLVGNLAVGIIGAVIGGFIFRLVWLSAYGTCGSLIMATIGALVLLFAVQVIQGKR
jgi:uncharacterized membrane protein YeaQ/YmgE (transglycosylase-associated protein family)